MDALSRDHAGRRLVDAKSSDGELHVSRANRRFTSSRYRGFSLVEVLVALLVCSIGLLGLAKMESLALSSTSVASSRSLAAIQASSLAATMHADRGYWGQYLAPASTTVTVVGSTVTISDTGLGTQPTPNCTVAGSTACLPEQTAAYDVQNWAKAIGALLPASFTTINCTTVTTAPVTCTIQIQWAENAVALNSAQTSMNTVALPTYVLYVQP
jgi:type IV pilus assembly protein PilV